jgi:hypothetical protein
VKRAAVLSITLFACRGDEVVPARVVSDAPAAASAPTATATYAPRPYPPVYRILPDGELEERARAAEHRNASWLITVDSFGLLHRAICLACSRGPNPNEEDRERVRRFASANGDLLDTDDPSVRPVEGAGTVVYEQIVRNEHVASVHLERVDGRLAIVGHAWPGFTLPQAPKKSDGELERALHAINPITPDGATPSHQIRMLIRRGGEVEFRQVACISLDCVDARTGEDVTRLLARENVSVREGVVLRWFTKIDGSRF